MQDLINDAVKNSQEESKMREESLEDDDFGEPRIVIVGCGGAGNNTVNRLNNIGVEGAETIAINTDKQHLQMIDADTKMLVGKSLTKGLGAGGEPELGAKATELASGSITEALGDADLVFITAGMGGGTGTGSAPVVSKIAKDMGAIVVGMVSTPFEVERARLEKASQGLENLRQQADSIIVLDNNRLLDYVPNLPVGKAFSVMDQIISETVKGISETITQPSLINLDYADMRSIMGHGGVAVMLVGESSDNDKHKDAVSNALNHPLLDVDYRGATGGLVHITGGPDLSLEEAQMCAKSITERLDSSANVIWGARIQKEFEGKLRVMAVMTGVQSPQIHGPSQRSNQLETSAPEDSAEEPQAVQSRHGVDVV